MNALPAPALLALLGAFAQGTAPAPAAPAPASQATTPGGGAAPAERPAWDEAFSRFRAAVELGDHAAALAASGPWLAEPSLDERRRAALRFGLGLAAARGEDPALLPGAVEDFRSAAALAGPGPARLDASYDAGVARLFEAEELRARIPEIAGGSPAAPGSASVAPPAGPGAPPGAAPPVPGGGAQEDPLPAARAAYEAARGLLVERLRADWRDADTRANLELVQRRLRELDEIERRREEQEQQQEQQEQDQEQEDEGQEDQDQQGDQEQDEDGEREPSQEDPSGDREGQESPDQEPQERQEGDRQQEDEQEEREPRPGEEDEAPAPSEDVPIPPEGEEPAPASQLQDEERHLTREEALRLFDRLAELEAEARALEARLKGARRESVERDW